MDKRIRKRNSDDRKDMKDNNINNMNEKVAISIIMPIFNEERTIDRCLQSIYQQSINSFEILCCDDGSTDGTLNILQTYEKQYDNIKVFRQENSGAGAARNLCLKHAVGEFVCFMDADDYYIDTRALEMIYNATKERGLDVGCAFLQENDENGEIRPMPFFRDLVEETPGVIAFKEYQNDVFFQCYMFRRRLIIDNDITFPLFRRFQDPVFLAQCLHMAEKFVVVPVEFYFHNRDDNKIIYDRAKANDIAKGLKSQLKFAIEHEYFWLQKKMESRLNGVYGKILIQNLTPDNYELLKILIEINDLLDTDHFALNVLKYLVMDNRTEDFETRKIKYKIREKIGEGHSVLVYGAGAIGKKCILALTDIKEIEVKGWVDKNKSGDIWNGFSIISPTMLKQFEYDYILIAIEKANIVKEVYQELLDRGIPQNMIVCWAEII